LDTQQHYPGRKSERFALEAPIQFTVALNPHVLTSKISDCSEGGLRFESGVNLRPGTVVFVAAAGDSRYYRAEVKWAEQLAREGAPRYAIGAEYLDEP
jgi:hypothetical protein